MQHAQPLWLNRAGDPPLLGAAGSPSPRETKAEAAAPPPRKRAVLLLTGCERYAADLADGIRRFRDPNWHVVGLVGGGSGEAARWTEMAAGVSMLRVAAPDDYAGLAEKIFAGLAAVERRFGQSLGGVFKTDDDILLSVPAAQMAAYCASDAAHALPWAGVKTALARAGCVSEARLRARSCGKLGPLPDAARLRYPATLYCYGAGYWLNAATVRALLAAAGSAPPPCVLEDVSVGILLNRLNMLPAYFQDVSYRELPRRAEREGVAKAGAEVCAGEPEATPAR